MKTTKAKRDEFIAQGSEIKGELYSLFGEYDPIHIADIGACDGLSSIIYANLFPMAEIHAFEPVKSNYDEMLENFRDYSLVINRRVHTYLCALGSKRGQTVFYRSSGQAPNVKDWETGNKSGSLLKPKRHLLEHLWCEFKREDEIIVDVSRLDDFHISIDFAHIDVQGSELQVLIGGRDTFKKARAIWIEVANIELYSGQVLKSELSRYLDSMGFVIKKDTCGKEKTGDMLWLKR